MFGWFSGYCSQIIIEIARYYVSVVRNGNKCLYWTLHVLFHINCRFYTLMTKNNLIIYGSYFYCSIRLV